MNDVLILGVGDIHARKTRPRFRIGDFWGQFQDKVQFVVDVALEKEVAAVCLPGDVFDTVHVPYSVTQFMMGGLLRLRRAGIEVFSVMGQHDQHNHRRRLDNTPYGLLMTSGAVCHLGNVPVKRVFDGVEVHFYGASWGEDVPEIRDAGAFNVLLIHRMIIDGFRLWQGQEQFITGKNFLRLHKFDLVVAGDNHKRFAAELQRRFLCNGGSLARLSIDQKDHAPAVYVFDVKERVLDWIYVPVVPWADIVNEQYQQVKRTSEQLKKFVESIANMGRRTSGALFRDRLLEVAEKTGEHGIIKEINGVLQEVSMQ